MNKVHVEKRSEKNIKRRNLLLCMLKGCAIISREIFRRSLLNFPPWGPLCRQERQKEESWAGYHTRCFAQHKQAHNFRKHFFLLQLPEKKTPLLRPGRLSRGGLVEAILVLVISAGETCLKK